MIIGVERPTFDLGRVFERTFGAVQKNFLTFFLLSITYFAVMVALVAIPLAAFAGAFKTSAGAAPNYAAFGLIGLFTMFAYFVTYLCLQASLTHGALSFLNGGKATYGECLKTGFRNALPMLGIGVLCALGCYFGLLLLIVPGVIFALMWSVSGPVQVVERRGVLKSMGRSRELTRNHRFALMGLFIILGVVGFFINLLVGGAGAAILGAIPGVGPFLSLIVQVIAYSVSGMIGAVGVACAYYELRQVKDGVVPTAIASVFD